MYINWSGLLCPTNIFVIYITPKFYLQFSCKILFVRAMYACFCISKTESTPHLHYAYTLFLISLGISVF